jgi:hypothetical protein
VGTATSVVFAGFAKVERNCPLLSSPKKIGRRADHPTVRGWTVGLVAALAALLAAGPSTGRPGTLASGQPRVFFDDFDYRDRAALTAHGWYVRTLKGEPGASGARWSAGDVAVVPDPARTGNRLLRLTASTDGTVAGTDEAEVGTTTRPFLEGTYAARVRFTGTSVDRIVQTFFAIGPPLARPLDPAYSELDFEYLANGGWGADRPTLFMTSWDTYEEEPPVQRLRQSVLHGSLGGWHTVVLQVHAGRVRYFVDGRLEAEHGGRYYPNAKMAVVFNLWFLPGGLAAANEPRSYSQYVDWFLQEPAVLSPSRVAEEVTALRRGAAG